MKTPSARRPCTKESGTPPADSGVISKKPTARPAKNKPAAALDVSKVKVLNVQTLKVKYVIRKPITTPDWENLHWRPKPDNKGDIVTYEHVVLPPKSPNTHTETGGASGSNMAVGTNQVTVNDGANDGGDGGDMMTGGDSYGYDSDEGASDHPHVPTPTSSPEPVFAEHAPELSIESADI